MNLKALQNRISDQAAPLCILAGFYLLAVVSRWLLISGYGSDVPYLDEWNDSVQLVTSIAKGQVEWARFLSNHNGHIHFTERVMTALCFLANDLQWDVKMQSTMNALVGSLIPVVLVGVFCPLRSSGTAAHAAGLATAALIWMTSALWCNATWSIQGQVYHLLLFSLLAMILLLRSRVFSPGWVAGVVCLLLAVVSMGSGAVTAVAIVGAIVLGAVRDRRFDWRRDTATLIVALAVIVLGAVVIDGGGAEKVIGPKDFGQLLMAMARNLAWPWTYESAYFKSNYIGLLLSLPVPALILAWLLRARWLREETGAGDVTLRILAAVSLWGVGQLLVLSIMRGVLGRGGSWRHFDMHAIWIFANVAALIILARSLFPYLKTAPAQWRDRGRALGALILGGFASLLVGGMVNQCVAAQEFLESWRLRMSVEAELMRSYFVTENRQYFNRPATETPFAATERPWELLDDPVVRDLLPAAVRKGLPLKPLHDTQAPRAYLNAPAPPGIFAPPGVNLWVSWRPGLEGTVAPPSGRPPLGAGEWEVPASRFSYLELGYTGNLHGARPPLMMLFPSGEGVPSSTHLKPAPGHEWRKAVLHRDAPGAARLRIQEAGLHSWITVAEPVELGRLSVFCRWARDQFTAVVMAGTLLMIFGYARYLDSRKS